MNTLYLQKILKDHCLNKWDVTDINIVESPVKKPKDKTKSTKKNGRTEKLTKSKTTDEQTDCDLEHNLYSSTENNIKSTDINVEAWSSLGVPNVIIKALADQNFHSPTIIQARALPAAILGQRDILGAAETGSGKTLAFGIPIIKGILELKSQQTETAVLRKSINNNRKNKGWNCQEKETEGNKILLQ